jgi:hypothetical protein
MRWYLVVDDLAYLESHRQLILELIALLGWQRLESLRLGVDVAENVEETLLLHLLDLELLILLLLNHLFSDILALFPINDGGLDTQWLLLILNDWLNGWLH